LDEFGEKEANYLGRERILCNLCRPIEKIEVGKRSKHLVENHWSHLLEKHEEWLKKWILRAMDKHDDLHMFKLISIYFNKDLP
jgi:hypothetical protein